MQLQLLLAAHPLGTSLTRTLPIARAISILSCLMDWVLQRSKLGGDSRRVISVLGSIAETRSPELIATM